ncbi:MAG: AAA family ATPase [Eubacteriales bacterium]|nr:AAA family ATPase [Eubacteriales bacterium]
MKKSLILLAGYPATGKSYMCSQILSKYPQIVTVNQDEYKERKWDEFGFDNMEEKTRLEMLAWDEYYAALDENMNAGKSIISDYPFSEKQRGRLKDLSQKYGYEVITIRLLGDIDTLYERSKKRDLNPSRHLGHMVSRYHKGDTMEDRSQADCLVTYDIFVDRCLHKGYDKFQLGHLIDVDATDFAKIDYDGIIAKVGSVCSE